LEFSFNQYVHYINFLDSFWGWVGLSTALLLVAHFWPPKAVALMSFYPTVLWSASWKPIVTLYPVYLLVLFMVVKYHRRIFRAITNRRYNLAVMMIGLITCWSLLSPIVYQASQGPAFTLLTTPNYQRGLLLLGVLLILPAFLQTRDDIFKFIRAFISLFIIVHCVMSAIAILFVASGHSIYQLHLMRVLDTPPIYWESGLLLIGLAYLFVERKMKLPILIVLGLVGLVGLIIGGSRTRFLTTFICLLYFMYPYMSVRLTVACASLAFFIFVVVLCMPGSAKNYFSTIIGQRIEQSTIGDIKDSKEIERITSRRTVTYKKAFERWRERPIFGVGSCYILPRDAAVVQGKKSMPRVHNYILEVLAGQGIVGISLLMAVLVISFKNIWRISKYKSSAVIGGRLIIALFGFGLINWVFKESWGITFCVVIMLSAYAGTLRSANNWVPVNGRIRNEITA
jgi:O-antigen ligase